jgi:alkylation response protein AidB-like acyl-CoA dehydrogenase
MYGLTEDDRRIRDTARAFVESLMPHEVEAELAGGILPKEVTAEHQARAIELGLYATNMPTSVGGPGCTALQQVLVQEQCGRVTNGLAWVMATPPQWWAEVATDYQRERWLLPSVRGEKHEAYAITEEFAGSDVSALQTTARRNGDEYVINGVKWHVTSFNLADYVFVEAVLDSGDHVLLVVDLPWPGVEVVRSPKYSHHIADEHPIVAFNDVRVPTENLVGIEGGPMTFTQDWFRFERMMVAARCVGAAQRLVDETTAFAQTRVVDGKPLGEHQLVAGMLADCATELFAARTMLYEVARSIDAGHDRKTLHGQASMAKLYCSEMAGRVADRAVQIFGGSGYVADHGIERLYRDVRIFRIYEGTSQIQQVVIARETMKRGG